MDVGGALVLVVMASVTASTVLWCVHHVRKERQRRRHVDVLRTQLVHRPTVAELRAKCSADTLPSYPKAPAALNGRAAAQGCRSQVSGLAS